MDTSSLICAIGPLLLAIVIFLRTPYWTRIVQRWVERLDEAKRSALLRRLLKLDLLTPSQYQQLEGPYEQS